MQKKYYTEYPTWEFWADSDEQAKEISKAEIIYRESDTESGRPFVMVRENKPKLKLVK